MNKIFNFFTLYSGTNSHINLNTSYLQPKEVFHVMRLNYFITLSNWINKRVVQKGINIPYLTKNLVVFRHMKVPKKATNILILLRFSQI